MRKRKTTLGGGWTVKTELEERKTDRERKRAEERRGQREKTDREREREGDRETERQRGQRISGERKE